MRSRSHLLEKFSTFIQFDADRFAGWVADARLRRHMQQYLEISPEQTDALWARYWHEVWSHQPQSMAHQHLLAYLQEPCYYATQKVLSTFQQYLSVQYQLPDCFQEAIARTDIILKNFSPDRASLNTYAEEVFRRMLTGIFRERRETEACSDWALLRRIRKKQLTEALERLGLSSIEVNQSRLAWQCFKALYAPVQLNHTDKLPKPDPTLWQAIAQLYNQERLSQLSPPGLAWSPEQIEQRIVRCAAAIRAYRRLATRSLDAPRSAQETGGWVDDLPDSAEGSLLDQVIVQEEIQAREQQKLQIQDVLLNRLRTLDLELQTIVQLYYQQGLNQTEIARQLQVSQPKVCRRLNKAKEALLMASVQWHQQVVNKVPNLDLIEQMRTALEEWLKIRYGELGLASGQDAEGNER